jgi:hypothetical protein
MKAAISDAVFVSEKYRKDNDFKQAAVFMRKASSLASMIDGNLEQEYLIRTVQLLIEAKSWNRAITFSNLLKDNAQTFPVFRQLAYSLLIAGKIKESMPVLQKLKSGHPDLSEEIDAWMFLASLNQTQQTVKDFDIRYATYSKFISTRSETVDVLLKLGMLDLAGDLAERQRAIEKQKEIQTLKSILYQDSKTLRFENAQLQTNWSSFIFLQKIPDITSGDDRDLPKALMFRMLLELAYWDGRQIYASRMEQLIDEEARSRRGIAFLYAGMVAEKYLLAGNVITARRFFEKMKELKHTDSQFQQQKYIRLESVFDWIQKSNSKRDLISENDPFLRLNASFSESEWNQQMRQTRLIEKDRLALLVILDSMKRKAISGSSAAHVLNLMILEHKLKTKSLPVVSDTLYENYASRIQTSLPADHALITYVDLGDESWSLKVTKQSIQLKKLSVSGFQQRSRMFKYLSDRFQGHSVEAVRMDLSTEYRSMLDPSHKVTYLWMTDTHVLAPLIPERGDRLYMIQDPVAFLQHQPLTSTMIPSTFEVKLSGSFHGSDNDLARLEMHSAGQTGSRGPAWIRSLPVSADFLNTPWLITAYDLRPPLFEMFEVGQQMAELQRKAAREGVIFFSEPSVGRAGFIRGFFKRSQGRMDERFVEASLDASQFPGDDLNMRLFTPGIMIDP